jgi:UDP-glucose 4-epimerase
MTANTILVTGGAGYIGSHIAYAFYQKGYQVIILDSLLYHPQWSHTWATLYRYDYADQAILEEIFTHHTIAAVVHCAAFIEVGRSVTEPLAFYDNNVAKTITLLNTMRKHHIKHVIFSSSCAVYGIPHIVPITEDHSKLPISPYGWSKLMIEQVLTDMHHANIINFVALRYFNAAGSTFELGLCEQHIPETHAIPLLCAAAYHNTPFYIFGTDHDTPDGSCIRDFLHVKDIAQAHVQAFEYLHAGNASACFNLGTGNGISVLELIDTVQRITGRSINTIYSQKRSGDPARLVADTTQANNILSWQPKYSDLDIIVYSAWQGYLLSHNKHQKAMAQKQKNL